MRLSVIVVFFVSLLIWVGVPAYSLSPRNEESLRRSFYYYQGPVTSDDMNTAMADRYSIYAGHKTVSAELTFYTSLASCNGEANVGRNAIGGFLSSTSIAIPRGSMPFGTHIYIEGVGMRIADDVGHPNYIRIKDDGTYIFDIYCPRLNGENDDDYKSRIMSYGRVKTKARIYDFGLTK